MAMRAPIDIDSRRPDRRTEAEDLQMEVRSLEHDRRDVARQLRWLSRLVMKSVLLQRDDLAAEAAGHLDHIAARLERQGGTTA
jgi:hypothetical protein